MHGGSHCLSRKIVIVGLAPPTSFQSAKVRDRNALAQRRIDRASASMARASSAARGLEQTDDGCRAYRQQTLANVGVQHEMPVAFHRRDQQRLCRLESFAADPVRSFP